MKEGEIEVTSSRGWMQSAMLLMFSEWDSRDELQKKLDVSRNTIKDYTKKLSNEGLIEMSKGSQLNDEEFLKDPKGYQKLYDGNKIYLRRCQKGIKKPLIRCQTQKLKKFLEEKTGKLIDTFDLNENIEDIINKEEKERYQNEGVKNNQLNTFNNENTDKNTPSSTSNLEIDTFSLTSFKECDIIDAPEDWRSSSG